MRWNSSIHTISLSNVNIQLIALFRRFDRSRAVASCCRQDANRSSNTSVITHTEKEDQDDEKRKNNRSSRISVPVLHAVRRPDTGPSARQQRHGRKSRGPNRSWSPSAGKQLRQREREDKRLAQLFAIGLPSCRSQEQNDGSAVPAHVAAAADHSIRRAAGRSPRQC